MLSLHFPIDKCQNNRVNNTSTVLRVSSQVNATEILPRWILYENVIMIIVNIFKPTYEFCISC